MMQMYATEIEQSGLYLKIKRQLDTSGECQDKLRVKNVDWYAKWLKLE